MMYNHSGKRGITTLLVLAFMGLFMLILGTVSSFALTLGKYGRGLYDREQALHSAEAGLEYYRWFLAHFPNNTTNGTGLPGPYLYSVVDPEGAELGKATLTIASTTQCGQVQWIDVTSVGKSNLNPNFPRTLFGRYMRPSVANFSYLLNSNVWAGADRQIVGPYFSNGGIRMDGTNNSDVFSATSGWNCSTSYGCSPASSTASGVVGNGSGSALWKWPKSSVDFNGIATSLSSLKTYAQNNGGRYFGQASGGQNSRGYHVLFKTDGTFDVYRVTSTIGVRADNSDEDWFTEYSIINTETFVGNYTVPSSCSLLYFEDRVWLEGTVAGKVTVVAADLITSNNAPDIYLVNNISYTSQDGSSGMTVIAEDDVLIPLVVPSNMSIHGIFVAHSGRFGRNFYASSTSLAGSGNTVPSAYHSYVLRGTLTTYGSVVSNERTGTSWNCGGWTCGGFQSRIDAYDLLQSLAPPPFTPSASPDYRYIIWRED